MHFLLQIRSILVAVRFEHHEILGLIREIIILGVLVQGRGQVIGDDAAVALDALGEAGGKPDVGGDAGVVAVHVLGTRVV